MDGLKMIKAYESKVLGIKKTTNTLAKIDIEKPAGLKFIPGQYISIMVDKKTKLRRPYSIASTNEEGQIKLCIRNVHGIGSEYLFSLKVGDTINYLASIGAFKIRDKKKDAIFIATGTGIAPFRSMILDILGNKDFKKNIILIRGVRDRKDLIYESELKELSNKYTNFKLYDVLSQPKKKYKMTGYVQHFFEKIIPENYKGDFYVCGLNKMIDSVKEKLIKMGYKEKSIIYEEY